MPRFHARIDANQKSIVEQLRQCGVSVIHLHTLGGNKPDILCGYRGVASLLEIKRPEAKTKALRNKAEKKRVANQQSWIEAWPGPAAMVYSFEEAWLFIQHGAQIRVEEL